MGVSHQSQGHHRNEHPMQTALTSRPFAVWPSPSRRYIVSESLIRPLDMPRKAEVAQFDFPRVCHQEILRLDVPVDYVSVVDEGDGCDELWATQGRLAHLPDLCTDDDQGDEWNKAHSHCDLRTMEAHKLTWNITLRIISRSRPP